MLRSGARLAAFAVAASALGGAAMAQTPPPWLEITQGGLSQPEPHAVWARAWADGRLELRGRPAPTDPARDARLRRLLCEGPVAETDQEALDAALLAAGDLNASARGGSGRFGLTLRCPGAPERRLTVNRPSDHRGSAAAAARALAEAIDAIEAAGGG